MTTPKLKNVSQKQSNISKKSSNTDLVNVDEENQVENAGAGLNELEDRTPYWATKEYLKVKKLSYLNIKIYLLIYNILLG